MEITFFEIGITEIVSQTFDDLNALQIGFALNVDSCFHARRQRKLDLRVISALRQRIISRNDLSFLEESWNSRWFERCSSDPL